MHIYLKNKSRLHILSRSDLKRRSLRLFEERRVNKKMNNSNNNNNKMNSDMGSPDNCDTVQCHRQTDGRQDYANSRSYCVAVRSAKNACTHFVRLFLNVGVSGLIIILLSTGRLFHVAGSDTAKFRRPATDQIVRHCIG